MSIRDKARAEAEKRWPPYPAVEFWRAEDRQAGFLAGAEWSMSLPQIVEYRRQVLLSAAADVEATDFAWGKIAFVAHLRALAEGVDNRG